METEASIESARKDANLGEKKLIYKTTCCKESKKLKRFGAHSLYISFGKRGERKNISFYYEVLYK